MLFVSEVWLFLVVVFLLTSDVYFVVLLVSLLGSVQKPTK